MALRAILFDYGMVLSGPQDPAAHAEIVRLTGLPADHLDEFYWAHRHAYDLGTLTGRAFWETIVQEAGLDLASPAASPSGIAELVRLDGRLWMNLNPGMVAWQLALKRRGFLTAILSNMGDTVHEALVSEFDWLKDFDLMVWSHELGIVKPDAGIYRFALNKLSIAPEDVLFLDDRLVNVEAAVALGMKALVFTDVDRLRADLLAAGLDGELPLPG